MGIIFGLVDKLCLRFLDRLNGLLFHNHLADNILNGAAELQPDLIPTVTMLSKVVLG